MNKTRNIRRKGSRRWAYAGLGLAGVVLAVNVGFILASTMTNPGLVNQHYDQYGSKQYLIDARYRDQMERGWHLDLQLPPQWRVRNSNTITLTATDKAMKPILGARAEIAVYRPSDIDKDVYLELNEDHSRPGTYLAELALPMEGTWDLNLLFKYKDKSYLLHKRVSAKGPNGAKHHRSLLEKIVTLVTPSEP
jgi:hypothetical protein